jgi:hypothetical protein
MVRKVGLGDVPAVRNGLFIQVSKVRGDGGNRSLGMFSSEYGNK